MVSKGQLSAEPSRSRLPQAFDTRPRSQQVILGIVVPAVLGGIAGLVLGWSAIGYWVVSALATIGGFLAGLEQHGARSGALRGVVGGVVYGAFILLLHALTGAEATVSLGDVPAFLVVITGVAGTILGAVGGVLRARAVRR